MTDTSCFAIFFNVLIDKSDVELGDLIKKKLLQEIRFKCNRSNQTEFKNFMSGRNRANGNVVYESVERLEVNKANFFPICL